MTVLAIIDDIQANLSLTLHNAVNLILQQRREVSLAERTGAARTIRLDQLGGTGQGTNMSGANGHRSPFSNLCTQPTFRVSRTRPDVHTVTNAINHSSGKTLIHARTPCVFLAITPTSVHPLTRRPSHHSPPEYRAKTTPTQPGPRP